MTARLLTASPGRCVQWVLRRAYGYVPGIVQVVWPDRQTAIGLSVLYNRLHLGKASKLTRLHREMVATVVNGKIGGAP